MTVLGSGTSTGIPVIGCSCSVCQSDEPKNKRLRSSLWLQTSQQESLLIDVTPDLRQQCLANKISHLDAVIITHEHSDHIGGLDDLRPFCFSSKGRYLPLWTSKSCAGDIEQRFPYLFKQRPSKILGGGIANLNLNTVETEVEVTIGQSAFTFFSLPHGRTQTLGFRHSNFAYLIDCQEIPQTIMPALKNLDLLIIDCVNKSTHETHLSWDKTLSYLEKIRPARAGLIHMGHVFDHHEMDRELKEINPHYFATYDQQVLSYT